ncbi:RsmB/NOP family class I SAM-dependent RNA methyltransferase [Acidisphaera sp. L21]|uniref:RsmB/NOP family class I SAM-dependent RNA methyltransferase n=1 Tax=Acidisphaera sp. L21 TaxID=1641851 RepID=UPI00131BF659|nr:RsmB/NOP family class I SAM-dependent RNA methyltransferase [Acidisphaera sp. L21]
MTPRTPPPRAARPDPTREGAFDLLSAVLVRHRSLEDALDTLPPGELRDRAAAHRLAAAVLRRTGSLDQVIKPHLRRDPPDPVRQILRMGAAQLLLLDTPAHAAVATAVALARSRGLTPFTGLVNAVLRRVAESGAEALAALEGPRLDTPHWLWSSWGNDAALIAAGQTTEAPLDLTVIGEPPPGGVVLPTGSVRYPAGTRVTELAGYEEGRFWVQDAAAALPARLLAAKPGESVADLCAAPGGKAAQLAATGATVTAIERDGRRIGRLNDNLARLRLPATVVQADATTWRPPALLDAVLLDAPCSATGTIRRHPDVVHLKSQQDVTTAVAQQQALIIAAAAMLRPGGRLIYAVCSMQPEEGPGAVPVAMNAGLRHERFTADELSTLPAALTKAGYLRTHPGLWPEYGGMDGFFAARFVKI